MRSLSCYHEVTNDMNVADGRKGNAGIGLSVCATIIKAHGGRIKAENIDEGGACFTLVLDLEDEHEE